MNASQRGRPPALSEADIVEATLRICAATSFDALTMRGLAADLGVGAMTIYNYVPNKDALAAMVCDHLLSPIGAPSDDGAWEDQLFALHRAIRSALERYPRLAWTSSTEGRRLAQVTKSILADAGFGPVDAQLAYGALSTITLGHIDARRKADRDQIFEFAFAAVLDAVKQRPTERRGRRPRLRGRG